MEAIINSKMMSIMPSTTSTIKPDAVQESNTNISEADKYLDKKLEIDEMVMTKRKLDEIYKRVKPLHRLIWDEHFIDGRRDSDIYYGEDITKRTYYREKNELMQVVAECLGVGTK